MQDIGGSTGKRIGIGLALTLALLALAAVLAMLDQARSPAPRLPVYGPVSEFSLTNQAGQAVTLRDLAGHVWVADVIFTRCPGPCLKMSRQMMELQQALPAGSPARLVSLTTDPEFDTPAVFKAYATRFNADPARWQFLTGDKQQLMRLTVESLKLTALAKKPEDRESPQDLFLHSTIFVLVDRQGRLRGVFETAGEGVDPRQVQGRILAAVAQLEAER
jgi:protein SCO1